MGVTDACVHIGVVPTALELGATLSRCFEAGVTGVVFVTRSAQDIALACELVGWVRHFRPLVNVHLALGLAPGYASEWSETGVADVIRGLAHEYPHVVSAIGECGLDNAATVSESARMQQRIVFLKHMELARELGLPLLCVEREAFDDFMTMTTSSVSITRGIPHIFVHCFMPEPDESDAGLAKRLTTYIQAGFMIGVPAILGNVAIPSRHQYRRWRRLLDALSICGVPPNQVLIETNTPLHPPLHTRTQRNNGPHLVGGALEGLALVSPSFHSWNAATNANFARVFSRQGPPPPPEDPFCSSPIESWADAV